MLAVPTTCAFCGCGCGFYLLVNKGRLVGVAPSENHPVSHGKLCARGWSAHEAPLWGDRLREPWVSWTGGLEPASWVSALDYLTSRMKKLMHAGKHVGVLGSARATNEENYLAGKLARVGLDTNNIDFSYHSMCRPILEGLQDVAGECASSASLHDVETSEAILLIEGDLAETHPRAASSVMRALERGARLITIGCRRTQMARLSSLHFETTPGEEGELMNGLLAAVVRLRLEDGRPLGTDNEGCEVLQRDLEAVKVTDELCQAARWIVGAKGATFLVAPLSGPRDQRRRDAASLATLAAVTGHLNKPGSGLLPLLARSNVRGACDMGVAPDRLPGYEPLGSGPAEERLQNLWGKSLPAAQGMDAEKLLQSVSGLIILADNPPSVLPMGQRATAALRKLEFLVVLDAFVTPATGLAHVVLPIASLAETEGTFTSMEGRVQRVRAATDPPGEAKAGWQVLAELCERFGVSASYSSAADVLREIAQAAPLYGGVEEHVLVERWSETRVKRTDGVKPLLHTTPAALTSSERPYVLAHRDPFDWGRDPMFSFSPTLSRDSRSERKLFPNGFVEVCQGDADSLGLHAGRRIKLSSIHGDAVVPIRLRTDLKPGVLLVPFAFRDHVANVLGNDSLISVNVEPA
jgi:predicted molibdopterin-dependent oxidoreductase YjgC